MIGPNATDLKHRSNTYRSTDINLISSQIFASTYNQFTWIVAKTDIFTQLCVYLTAINHEKELDSVLMHCRADGILCT